MKKLILLAALFAGGAFAQCGAYSNFASLTASTNLSGAMNGKLNIQCGTVAPTTVAGTAGVDAYVNTTNGNFYICTITGNPCGSGGSGWILQTGGSLAVPNSPQVAGNGTALSIPGNGSTTFSGGAATGPNMSTGCSSGPCNTLLITPSVDITSWAANPSGFVAGQWYRLHVAQPASAVPFTSSPSNITNFPAIPQAGSSAVDCWMYGTGGGGAVVTTCSNTAGYGVGTETAGPGITPLAGTWNSWYTNVYHLPYFENSSAVQFAPLVFDSTASGTASAGKCPGSQFATGVGRDGNLECGTPSGSGTVTSFSAGNLSPLFTTSVATGTSTPALSFALTNAAQNSVLAGPATGGAGAPSYQAAPTLSATNMTNLPITLTTTGSSGASTYTQSTNTLNIPQYSGGGSGGAALNPTCSYSSTNTSCGTAINVASLQVLNANVGAFIVGCSTVVATGYTSTLGATYVATITPTFSAAAGSGTCATNGTSGGVNSVSLNGGAANTGAVAIQDSAYALTQYKLLTGGGTAAGPVLIGPGTSSQVLVGGSPNTFGSVPVAAVPIAAITNGTTVSQTDIIANSGAASNAEQAFANTVTLGQATATTVDGVHQTVLVYFGFENNNAGSLTTTRRIRAGGVSGCQLWISTAAVSSTNYGDGQQLMISADGTTAGKFYVNTVGRSQSFNTNDSAGGAYVNCSATAGAGAWTLGATIVYSANTAGSAVCGSTTTGGTSCILNSQFRVSY